ERATPVSRQAMRPGDLLLLDTFGGLPPKPAILVSDGVLIEASPASGVNFLPLDESTRSRLREVRRFSGSPHAEGARSARGPRAAPAQSDLLVLFIVLTSQNAALVVLLLAATDSGGLRQP